MSETAARRSPLSRSWRAVSAGPRAYLRPLRQALDVASIQHSWSLMRSVQRQAFSSPGSPAPGIRLFEKGGRLDLETTRAEMQAYARMQFEAGQTSQANVELWKAATLPEIARWAVHEVRANRKSVYLPMIKSGLCGTAALLIAWLVKRPGMAVTSSIVMLLLCIFFVIASIRAVKNQSYLEWLVEGTDRQ